MSKLLPDDYINSVLDSTSIVDLIGQSIPLKKSGPEFVGLCPFHGDSSPSMAVNGAKAVYLCRVCGATGNALTFLTETTGTPFVQAVEQLAKAAGMPTPDEIRGRSPQENGKHKQLLDIVSQAEDLYRKALSANTIAQEYLHNRGITPEMAHAFGIGYAPPGRKYLEQQMQHIPRSLRMETGLFIESSYQKGTSIDFMESRIIFPIRNSSGKTIAFGGRSLVDGQDRKYINTPETSLFKKGAELYGLYESSLEIRKSKTAIVTEGYADVVIPHGHGVNNVVSAMGVALQPATIAKLFKAADTIVFCFDGDKAGQTAAIRAMELTAPLINERKRCRFAFLPGGMDPDDYVKAEGPDSFRAFIQSSEPMSKYMMRELKSRHEMDEVEGKAAFAADAMDLVERMTSPTVKGLMIQLVKNTIGEEIPLPGVTAGLPAVVPIIAPVPSRSAFARKSSGPATPQPTPIKVNTEAATSAQNEPTHPAQASTADQQRVPTLALKILGVFLEEPLAADHVEPHWLNCVGNIPEHEIEAVSAVVDFVKGRTNDDITSNEILQNFSGTPVGQTLAEAQEDALKQQVKTDPIERMAGFMAVLTEMNARAQNAKRLGIRPR